MPAECVFTLPNGRKCRCSATRGHAFCRHHGAPRPPRAGLTEDQWNRLACWRHLTRAFTQDPVQEIPAHMLVLLQGLLEGNVSDRYAGRSLRILLQRLNAIPLIVAPEYDDLLVSSPPASARRLQPAPSLDPMDAQTERMLQELLSMADSGDVPRSRPPAVQSRPSTLSMAAAR